MKHLIQNALKKANATSKAVERNYAAIAAQLPKAQWPINPGGYSC